MGYVSVENDVSEALEQAGWWWGGMFLLLPSHLTNRPLYKDPALYTILISYPSLTSQLSHAPCHPKQPPEALQHLAHLIYLISHPQLLTSRAQAATESPNQGYAFLRYGSAIRI
eukprot:GHVN01004647.1.p1 GENE.GHVN01004647.1~~GHVN01004647.1.p1  ORF type:complete len:114 (+),score=15.34 GHVN01004647.1:352-693(+)